MIITEIRQLRPKSRQRVVKLEDGTSFVLYSGEIRRLSFLQEGEDLPEEAREEIYSKVLLPRVKKRCLHLLEKQDYTRASLIRKLTTGGYPLELAEAAVEYAASFHYIDDLRYARNYIHFHQEKKSPRRLRMDLRGKGVAEDLIQEAMEEELTVDEAAQIRALIEKKHYDIASKDPKINGKIYRFLQSRGYSYSLISEVLGSLREDTY
ncbi:MAG: regulatory protein RecX [Lachnospiraceae bacterium]|nr:regulatory protein RecX [Lachnospiraceae bacterium]MBQ5484653.1 regulatory protein RecX [Lachnospiraceae bacterium]